eukprot:jgi/Botrbrau1/13808/Bobra.0056s0055.2
MRVLTKIYPDKDYLSFDRHDMSIGGAGDPKAQSHLRLHSSKNTMFREGASLFPQRIYDDRLVHLYAHLLAKGVIPEAVFFVVDSYEDAKALADKVKPKRIWPSLGWSILVAWKMCQWPEGNPPKTHAEEWARIIPQADFFCHDQNRPTQDTTWFHRGLKDFVPFTGDFRGAVSVRAKKVVTFWWGFADDTLKDTNLYQRLGVMGQSCVKVLKCDPADVPSVTAEVDRHVQEAADFFETYMDKNVTESLDRRDAVFTKAKADGLFNPEDDDPEPYSLMTWKTKTNFSPQRIAKLTAMVEKDIAEGREDPSLMQPPPNGRVNGKAFSYIVRHKCTPGESGQPLSSGLPLSLSPLHLEPSSVPTVTQS